MGALPHGQDVKVAVVLPSHSRRVQANVPHVALWAKRTADAQSALQAFSLPDEGGEQENAGITGVQERAEDHAGAQDGGDEQDQYDEHEEPPVKEVRNTQPRGN